jgi:chaperonin cofactor prefoldin
MEDSFKLLESRIHRAAERLKELQGQSEALRDELQQARARATAAEARLEQEGGDDGGRPELEKKVEALGREVRGLRREREEIRARVERLVELLDAIE